MYGEQLGRLTDEEREEKLRLFDDPVADLLTAQGALFPAGESRAFGADEARLAAGLNREVARPRGREVDLAIAACAISWRAKLWTSNPRDFGEVTGLELWEPA